MGYQNYCYNCYILHNYCNKGYCRCSNHKYYHSHNVCCKDCDSNNYCIHSKGCKRNCCSEVYYNHPNPKKNLHLVRSEKTSCYTKVYGKNIHKVHDVENMNNNLYNKNHSKKLRK